MGVEVLIMTDRQLNLRSVKRVARDLTNTRYKTARDWMVDVYGGGYWEDV